MNDNINSMDDVIKSQVELIKSQGKMIEAISTKINYLMEDTQAALRCLKVVDQGIDEALDDFRIKRLRKLLLIPGEIRMLPEIFV